MVLPLALLLLLSCDTLCNLPGRSAVAAQRGGTPAHHHTTFLNRTILPDQLAGIKGTFTHLAEGNKEERIERERGSEEMGGGGPGGGGGG